MESKVLDYQKQLLYKGYRYLYLCEEIDAENRALKQYYYAVVPGEQPKAPCYNLCPILIESHEGLKILNDYLISDNVDICF